MEKNATHRRMKRRTEKGDRNGRKKRSSGRASKNRRSARTVAQNRDLSRRNNLKSVPRTVQQYFSRSRTFQDTWDHIVQVSGKMRSENVSLQRASRELGVSPNQVLRLARPAFRRLRNGRYVAKPIDRLLRILVLPSPKGLVEIAITDSRQASLIGEYWNALHRYLSTGDASQLEKFRKRRVTNASGKRIPLLTDLDELGRQASVGEFRFESLYGRIA